MSKLQIIALRKFTKDGKEITYDKILELDYNPTTLQELFKNHEAVVSQLTSDQLWNVFYTVARCGQGKREFVAMDTIAFDLDKCELERKDKYIDVVLALLQLPLDMVGVTCSGNGLHFLVGLKKSITSKDYIKKMRPHYRALVTRLNIALEKEGLPGNFDTVVWDARRILRLPGSINRKVDKPEVRSYMIQPNITPVAFNLAEASGLPEVKDTEQIPKSFMQKYPKTDNEAVVKGCDFIGWAWENQADVNEPQWYALLSILARLDKGKELCHKYSEKHPSYTKEECDLKIEQALDASGPRTCKNINDIWGKCSGCENKERVTSPILLYGENHIPTELTGFHQVIPKKNGELSYKPCYEDLRKFFDRQKPYKNLGDSRVCLSWNGSYYDPIGNASIEQFAQTHFNPTANNTMVREFRELVGRTNIEHPLWFNDTTNGAINFKNGTLEVATMEFFPHTPKRGFRYVLPYDYEPKATAPVFMKMLEKVTGANADLQKVIVEFMGYAVSNDGPWTQKAAVLVGEGANGKSTLMNVLKALSGEENHSSLTMSDIDKSEYNRHLLAGKLFNIAEETPTKALVSSSYFKTLVTGGEIQARSPYKDPYFVRSMAKFIFTCNELPYNIDTTYGFYRRLLLIPFDQKFVKSDPDYDPYIEQKLIAELPGIFNYVIQGYKRLKSQGGFTECEAINQEVEDYQEETDTVLKFVRDNLVMYENGGFDEHFVSIGDLYDHYKGECQYNGTRAVTNSVFGKKLSKIIPEYNRRYTTKKIDKKFFRGFKGVKYDKDEIIENKKTKGLHIVH